MAHRAFFNMVNSSIISVISEGFSIFPRGFSIIFRGFSIISEAFVSRYNAISVANCSTTAEWQWGGKEWRIPDKSSPSFRKFMEGSDDRIGGRFVGELRRFVAGRASEIDSIVTESCCLPDGPTFSPHSRAVRTQASHQALGSLKVHYS